MGMAKVIQFEPAYLYPKQRAAIYDSARISCIESSTKAGKTSGCLAWIIEQAMEGNSGDSYWWIAPVYSQAEIAFRRCWKMLTPIKHLCKRNQSTFTITLPNSCRLVFKSGDRSDDLYGEDVYACVMDEASRMREESWHAIRSTLTFTKGPVRIIGNVRGRKNWFYRLSRLAEEGVEDMSFHRITAWDAVQAGVLDKKEIEAARRDFSRLGQDDVFRELYMAEALDDASNPFGIAAIKACCEDIASFSSNHSIAGGVDLAGRGAVNLVKTGDAEQRDYTAIAMLDREGRCTYLDRFRKPHWETHQKIAQTVRRTQTLVDSTGTGDSMVEELQRRGDMRVLGFTFTPRSRQDLLEGLALAIQEGRISWPDVKTSDNKGSLRDELEGFEFEYTPSGVRYVAPEGAHDDLVMAMALAVKQMPWKLKKHMQPTGIPQSGGSKWTSEATGDNTAWKKYQESLKPTERSALGVLENPPEVTDPVPVIAAGSGISRWTEAG
jgi:Terminase RNaseH-like domain